MQTCWEVFLPREYHERHVIIEICLNSFQNRTAANYSVKSRFLAALNGA